MARKSRKPMRMVQEEVAVCEKVQKVPTVLYGRLSKADCDTGKDSMQNQIQLMKEMIAAREDLEIVDVFCDDGFTGTNFQRPAFEQMMEGIREGKYKCLVVKDLSRLGRSYLETSDLLEYELPLFGCRFISINDGIDTDVSQIDTILVGLKNIMNQKYAEDLSRKIKAVFKPRKERGQKLGGVVAYGYMRNPEDKGYLLIDEEAAKIVQRIFQMKIEELNDCHIARILNNEGILSPKDYSYWKKNGVLRESRGRWRPDTVRTITINPVYLGHSVQGKYHEKNYIGEKAHKTRMSDWVIYENINPPIVSQEIFDAAKAAREKIYRGNRK
jgi:DNA invertase Pin-like site-specific DNA recombinase